MNILLEETKQGDDWQGKNRQHSKAGSPTHLLEFSAGASIFRWLQRRSQTGNKIQPEKRKEIGCVQETAGIIEATVNAHAEQQISAGNESEGNEEMSINTPPRAGVSPPQNRQSREEHHVLDEREGIIGRVVFGEINCHELPGKTEVTIKSEPPKCQQGKINAAGTQIAARRSRMRRAKPAQKERTQGPEEKRNRRRPG